MSYTEVKVTVNPMK